MDTWLSDAAQNGIRDRMYTHGLFTYDYFQWKKIAEHASTNGLEQGNSAVFVLV